MKISIIGKKDEQGFTMIEMVAVLVVLFIVSAVVFSRYTMTGINELTVETNALKASLRYAQIQAMNDDTTTSGWGIYFPNDVSYILYKNGSPAVDASGNPIVIPVKDPDPVKDPPPNNTHTLQGNVRITAGVGTTVTFNKWGSPIDGSGNPLTTSKSITLAKGTETDTITVTRNTGYIP